MRRILFLLVFTAPLLRAQLPDTVSPAFVSCPPESVGMSSAVLGRIDSVVSSAVKSKLFPGCQVLVIKEGRAVYDKSFGFFTYDSTEPVTDSSIYDLASVSKIAGTLPAVMKLVDEGKLKLTDSIGSYLPFLIGTKKSSITVEQLLFHESGLPAGLPFTDLAIEKITVQRADSADSSIVRLKSSTRQYRNGWVSAVKNDSCSSPVADRFFIADQFHDSAMSLIARAPVKAKTYLYSDLNFILLKEIVEQSASQPLDQYVDSVLYHPMNLQRIGYLPLKNHPKEQIAPTLKNDFLRSGEIRGWVHDPDAAFFGGVSGHAGVFASARDLALVYQMILNGGELNGFRFISKETCTLFTSSVSKSGRRGLGFDKPNPSEPDINPCSAKVPQEVYGHTGYTGTCIWVDPVNSLIYLFLSNRTYPFDGANLLAKQKIRPKIQDIIYQSLQKK